MTPRVSIRDVTEEDLPFLYEHQADPEATRMAAFPSRDREAFDSHWKKIMADENNIKRAIVSDGAVAGNVLCFEQNGRTLVGYWIGKEFWGQGIATDALRLLLAHVKTRPLHAYVAKHNAGSIRVLEKCGFTCVGEDTSPTDGIEELIFELA